MSYQGCQYNHKNSVFVLNEKGDLIQIGSIDKWELSKQKISKMNFITRDKDVQKKQQKDD